MRLPLSWVRDYVKLTVPPARLAEQLTLAGLEVEEQTGNTLPTTVVVGHVLEVSPHPNADRLRVANVDLGDGRHEQIVCGAPNLAVGQHVPVAQPGTTLPNGATISAATIRGVTSAGMICAEDELGLGTGHEGILVLADDAQIGKPLNTVLEVKEAVLDLTITPNRADCLSILGCAREIGALTKQSVHPPKITRLAQTALAARELKVRIEDKAACPVYQARIIKGVALGPSPKWLQSRLTACGIRPLNAVIDATNYVMMELGQPLHAFDATALPDHTLIVRRARKGERLLALDGKTYNLTPTMLVIASRNGPVAIAGIMGGEASGIHATTATVVLESAVFDPILIRRTSKTLGLSSESSYRFERGIDAQTTSAALDRAAALIAELTGGSVARGKIAVGAKPAKASAITLSVERTNRMLNLSLKPRAIADLLKREGCAVVGTKTLRVTPPSWRKDLRIEEDCIEEVGRLYGYPKLANTLPAGVLAVHDLPPLWSLREGLMDALASCGGVEFKNYPFYDEGLAKLVGLDPKRHVRVVNPLSRDQELLRAQLLPALLRKAAMASREDSVVFLYELGRCFLESSQALPREEERVALVAVGQDAYRVLKGVITAALDIIRIPKTAVRWTAEVTRYGSGQRLHVADQQAGISALLSNDLRDRFKFRQNVAVFECTLEALLSAQTPQRFTPFSSYPALRRDLAFWIPTGVAYADIERMIAAFDPLLTHVEPFDVYEDRGRRSVAVHLTFLSPKRTLTAQEVDRILERLSAALTKTFHAQLRS